jgi:hypothetical protein
MAILLVDLSVYNWQHLNTFWFLLVGKINGPIEIPEMTQTPPLEVFTFPLRISTSIDFSSAFTKSSRKNTHDSEMSNKLQNARDTMIKSFGNENFIEKTTEYLSLFQGLVQSPIEETSERLTEEVPLLSSTSHANKSSKLKESVLFTWSSSLLDKSKKTPLADSSYELYCVLFNMAVSHLMSCRQGQNESNVTTCLETAGIFEYLETTLGEVNSDDISSEITGYLKKLCVSLAEESVSFLCLEQEEKFESMARVMRDSAKNYESLWSTFNSRFQNMKDFTLYLKYKAVSCDILSVLFSAVYYNKTDENGNGLALLDFCTKQMPRLKEV